MCIRDRLRTRLLDRGRRRCLPRRHLQLELEGGRGDRQLEPCLLYTSDAADERSSVDLGGRRIIKKKNKKTKEPVSYTKKKQEEDSSDTRKSKQSKGDSKHHKVKTTSEVI